jgi:hypothetical protein
MCGTPCLQETRLYDQKCSGMCHSAAGVSPYTAKRPSLPRRQRPRGQSGSRWGSRCQVVFKRGSCLSGRVAPGWAAWQSCVLLLTSSPSIWWRVARPDTHRLDRRTISLVRLARSVESRYTCWGCYHRVLYLPHTAIVTSCIEAKPRLVCSSVYHVDINAACRTPRAG